MGLALVVLTATAASSAGGPSWSTAPTDAGGETGAPAATAAATSTVGRPVADTARTSVPVLAVGLRAGEPTAASIAWRPARRLLFQLDGGLGLSPQRAGTVSVDALGVVPELLGPLLGGRLELRAGVGARLAWTRDGARTQFGARFPGQVAWVGSSVDLFVEISPGITASSPERVSFEGGAGVRFAIP